MTEQKARWYVVHVYSGSEKRVAEDIKEQAVKKGLDQQVLDIFIPVEEVVEIKKGKKISATRNFFPGYILVHMVLTNETWQLVKSTQKVTGFLGNKEGPSPLSQTEVNRILSQVEESQSKPHHTIIFEVGEQVRVSDGPFSSFVGLVEAVDEQKERLKVSVSIFGRATPVDLTYSQVEKVLVS